MKLLNIIHENNVSVGLLKKFKWPPFHSGQYSEQIYLRSTVAL